MTELKTDEEKGEEIIAWWRENWLSVVSGVVLAVGILFGYQYWQSYQEKQSMTASSLYSDMLEKMNSNALDGIFSQAAELKTDYSGTAYSALGALIAAKAHAANNDNEKALVELNWAVENADQKIVADLAKMQAARLQVAMAKYDQAESLLSQTFPVAWQSGIDELKGDIQLAKNNVDEAKGLYESAIRSSKGESTEYLQMKLDNLAK
jgi:predicted negative regulator of RcsB-dependent stress response